MDKIVITTGESKFLHVKLYPGIFLCQKQIYYCKGFKSDKELQRLLSYGDFGSVEGIYEPLNSKHKDDVDIKSDVTFSGFILRCHDSYYLKEKDFHRSPEYLVYENRRTVLIMESASSKMSFTSNDLDIISCDSYKPIDRDNMIIFLSGSKSPYLLVKELLSLKDDPLHTKYTFLFNDISLLKYMRELYGDYLSSEPFLNRYDIFTKVSGDDTIYRVYPSRTKENSTIKITTVDKDIYKIPCIPLEF